MGKILDTNRNTIGHYDRLKAAGYDRVIRYVSRFGGDKVVTVAEAHAIAAAGCRLGLVYETNGRPRGAEQGKADGEYARAYAEKVGAPAGAIIWYTADEDTTDALAPLSEAAFIAFRDAIAPTYRCGGYASGWFANRLYDKKIIVARWLTDSMGFRGTRSAIQAGQYELKQALPTPIAGLDTDPDAVHMDVDGKEADIGDFVPFGAVPAPAEPPPSINIAPGDNSSRTATTDAPAKRFTDITATVFGGHADRNTSAYDGHVINDTELGVALPARLVGPRPKVRVIHGDKSVVCDIVDVGPWNTNDPYWHGSGRPQAESGHDKTGRRTNHAGIDLTPGAARAIGIDGMGKVDWEFIA